MKLSTAHQQELCEESAIARDVASERGYETIGKNEVPETFGPSQRGAGLLIPLHSVYGEVASYQLKRNEPRTVRKRELKYETPKGGGLVIDVHPLARKHLDDPYKPIWITEGAKKADSALSAGLPCVIALTGVWNWRGSNKNDGLTALGDWEAVTLKHKDGTPRDVMLAFDSDIRTNVNVQRGVNRLKRFLESRGARCQVLVMPDLPDASKCGLDDWFANGGTLEDLQQHVLDDVPTEKVEPGEDPPLSGDDFRSDDRGFLRAGTKDGDHPWNAMTNFVAWARSVARHPENSELDYAEVLVRDANGVIHGPREVSLRHFRRPDEWIGEFGTWCRVFPRVQRDVLLNAIQVASGTPPVQTVYDRLGLVTNFKEDPRFLAGNGALGPDGLDTSIQVHAGSSLDIYEFTDAESESELREAMLAVLKILDIANTQRGVVAIVTLLAAAFRSPLMAVRPVRFSLAIVGETNTGKSGLASVIMNLFGRKFGYDRLPGNWISSAKSNADLITRAMHVMLVIDDYIEQSGAMASRQSAAREQTNRAIGNAATRNVLNRDGTRKDGREPAAFVVSTQESIGTNRPPSETSRQVIVTIERRLNGIPDVSIDAMKRIQRQYGHTGTFNVAMTGFVKRLLGSFDQATEELEAEHDGALQRLKETFKNTQVLERTLPNVAELMVGWNAMINYAESLGVFDGDCEHTVESLRKIGAEAFTDLVRAQAAEQSVEQPETVVIDLLREVLNARRASLRDRETGGQPSNPEMCGWTDRRIASYTRGTQVEYSPAQHQIGWIDDDYIYLQPKMAYQALGDLAKNTGTTLPVGERSLGVTLQRAGISEPGHGSRPTRNERVGATGKAWVLKVHRRHIFEEGTSTDAYEDNEGNITEIRRSA